MQIYGSDSNISKWLRQGAYMKTVKLPNAPYSPIPPYANITDPLQTSVPGLLLIVGDTRTKITPII